MKDDIYDQAALEAELQTAGCTIKGKSCTCPFHEDRTPSASIIADQSNHWRVFCHVCNESWDVLDLREKNQGKSIVDQLKDSNPRPQERPKTRSEAPARIYASLEEISASFGQRLLDVFPYSDPTTGKADLIVARVTTGETKKNGKVKKAYFQFSPVPGGFIAKKPEGQTPIFNRMAIAKAEVVVVVEGEPCVKALRSLKITATTSPGGAGKAALSNWEPLRGKTCILWPDYDDAGRSHMKDVERILEGLDCRLLWIEPEGMGLIPGGDVADVIDSLTKHLENFDDVRTTISGILEDAIPLGGSRELSQLYSDIVAGKYQAIPWPGLTRIGALSKACLPGSILTICADPGAGKSLLMLQMVSGWHQSGVRVALLALEDERKVHLQRIHAQLAKQSGLTDDDWIRNNPETVKDLLAKHQEVIGRLATCIRAEGEDQMKLTEIADWADSKMKSGCRIVVIDPVTAAVSEREPWAADTAFLMRVKRSAREHGASVILVTHPRGASAKGASLSSMAGGSAYPRFSHSAMWLEKFDTKDMKTANGETLQCNRSVKITKSRHGKGGGMMIGMVFDGDSLTFSEAGIVELDEAKSKASANKDAAKERSRRLSSKPQASEEVF